MGLFEKVRKRLFNRKENSVYIQKSQEEDEVVDLLSVTDSNPETNEAGVYEIVERTIYPEKIICPDCGGVTTEGLDFCDKCGGELYKMFQ